MQIDLISISRRRKPADLFFIGLFEGEKSSKLLTGLEPNFANSAEIAIKNKRFSGKKGESLGSFNPEYREASEILLVGLGSRAKFDSAALRDVIGKLIQVAASKKGKRVRILLDSFTGGKIQAAQGAETIAEMTSLASYSFDKYKTKKKEENDNAKGPEVLEILFTRSGDEKNIQKNIDFAQIVASGTLTARNLINEPGNVINPAKLAEEARRIGRGKGVRCTILGPADLKRLKMGGILGVNQGSKTPPALIILEYGASHKKGGTVCLVGKGVTFDSGGISIKPANDMEKMKYDKAGACTVIATIGAVADLKLPVHVIALAPAVENLPSENPQRPGDIIRMYSGKTVEVINTDAEGRLILADALAYTAKYKPKAIIDLATLTGMCAYTFGDKACGIMGNDRSLVEKVKKAGEQTGERCWELPMWDEYLETMKGHHSDLLNAGGKHGGTITAAKFLEEFVPKKTAWVHLDIAGTAWCDTPRSDCPKGATGFGVRLLINFLQNWR
ncbi:MAG: leucyl aminopeptidase [Candidatus Omnitrophica bacterium]|nr:leucyl aminopeptidase [Candidatus Omnitrophota bacterium]